MPNFLNQKLLTENALTNSVWKRSKLSALRIGIRSSLVVPYRRINMTKLSRLPNNPGLPLIKNIKAINPVTIRWDISLKLYTLPRDASPSPSIQIDSCIIFGTILIGQMNNYLSFLHKFDVLKLNDLKIVPFNMRYIYRTLYSYPVTEVTIR